MDGDGTKDLFLDLRPGGTAEGIAKLFPPPGFYIAAVDGAAARDKVALMDALAAAFRFPPYFGRNWDALLDCLRSLPDFNPAGGYVLALKNYDVFLSDAPAEKEAFLEVAGEAAAFLMAELATTFRIVLY